MLCFSLMCLVVNLKVWVIILKISQLMIKSIAVPRYALRRMIVEIKKLFAPICVNGGGIMSELPESITPMHVAAEGRRFYLPMSTAAGYPFTQTRGVK